MRLIVVTSLVLATLGCGGRPPVPKRLVVEGDVGAWKFRRFQGPLYDIEVWVEGNRGEAYSASYITEMSEKTGKIGDADLVNVTVTKYEKPEGVTRETVRLARRLASERGYQVAEEKIEGVKALAIVGTSEMWVMWPSGQYVVKVGGHGRNNVPEAVVESYGDRYPSGLPGGALEGALPPETTPQKGKTKPEYDPNNPKPDIEKYDPAKVKLPKSKGDGEDAEVSDDDGDDDAPKKKTKSKSK
jgi:hypothetical protein